MIYLDYAATTPVDEGVGETFAVVQRQVFGNPHSLHQVGIEASNLLAAAKKQMADLLDVEPRELIMTSGATEANNLALLGVARAYKQRGNHIITTNIEHASVSGPLHALEREGFEVTYLPVDADGLVHVDDVLAAMQENTILVSIMHINNEIGSIQPVAKIAHAIKERKQNVFIHSDMAQSIGKSVVDLTHIDLATFSGHKFYAPKSVGLLYKRHDVALEPLFYGGSQQDGLRPGTEHAALVAAMAKAMRLAFERVQSEAAQVEMIAKRNYIVHEIVAKEDNVRLTIAHDDFTKVSPHIIHLQVVNSETEVQTYLNALMAKDIYLSTRSTCHSSDVHVGNPLLEALGYSVDESRRGLRVSLSHLTTREELETFGAELKDVVQKLLL